MAVVPAGSGMAFRLLTMITLTTGTVFLMWLGERITENGIGNGISQIFMISILSRFPANLNTLWVEITTGSTPAYWGLAFIVLLIAVVAGMTMVQQGQRKIPIQYAKRTMGRRIYDLQCLELDGCDGLFLAGQPAVHYLLRRADLLLHVLLQLDRVRS